MKVESKDYSFDLPAGYVDTRNHETISWSHAGEGRQITLSVRTMSEDSPVDDTLRDLAALYLEAMKKSGGAEHTLPVQLEQRDDLRLATFLAAGNDPLLSFCALVTHTSAVLGQRWVVSLNVHQYFRSGTEAPNVDAFAEEARAIVATLEPLPIRARIAAAASSTAVDLERHYPYVVPGGYVADREDRALAMPRPLGHGLFLAIAHSFDVGCEILFAEDLDSLGGPDAILAIAQDNLVRAAREARVSMRVFEGPRGLPVLVVGPEWLAASCLLLPDLHALAGQHLGEGPLCASIPHRDAMFLFRQEDASYRAEMRMLIAANEREGEKPLTMGLFAVTVEGFTSFAD